MRTNLNATSPPRAHASFRTLWDRNWRSWFGLVLCLCSNLPLTAQGKFNGKNSSTSLVLSGDGLKLSKAIGRVEIVYKDVVLNISKNTFTADGIFGLGLLTIPDVGAGGTATVTVRAWDSARSATYAEAFATGDGFGNSTFDVWLTDGVTPVHALENFRGFTLMYGVVIPALGNSVTTMEGGPVALPLQNWPASPVGSGWPRYGIVTDGPAGRIYVPNANVYGKDGFTISYPSFNFSADYFVDVLPSPARLKPTLALSSSKRPRLLGLDAHRYLIEKSSDLSAWSPVGEVVGNFSEVDLSPFLAPDDRTQFLRATDITKP